MKLKEFATYFSAITLGLAMSTQALPKDNLDRLISTSNTLFMVSLKQNMGSKVKETGYELVSLYSLNSSTKELANIKDLIEKKTKLVLINPTESVVSSIKEDQSHSTYYT